MKRDLIMDDGIKKGVDMCKYFEVTFKATPSIKTEIKKRIRQDNYTNKQHTLESTNET